MKLVLLNNMNNRKLLVFEDVETVSVNYTFKEIGSEWQELTGKTRAGVVYGQGGSREGMLGLGWDSEARMKNTENSRNLMERASKGD